jgi:hypothetical protein
VDQLGSDTCHHYKGDMWHILTDDVADLTHGRYSQNADREDM